MVPNGKGEEGGESWQGGGTAGRGAGQLAARMRQLAARADTLLSEMGDTVPDLPLRLGKKLFSADALLLGAPGVAGATGVAQEGLTETESRRAYSDRSREGLQ